MQKYIHIVYITLYATALTSICMLITALMSWAFLITRELFTTSTRNGSEIYFRFGSAKYCCMHPEAKHCYFESLAHKAKRFNNIERTLSDHYQNLMCYYTSTSWFINKTNLSLTANYTYIVKGWNGKESDISATFTLATTEVTVTDDKTDATNPCKSDNCCANVTLKIMQVPSNARHASQHYNVSYNSTNGNISVPECEDETGWCAHGLPHDNTYCFTIIPINDYNSGVIKRGCVKIPKYQCQTSPEKGDGLSAGAIVGIVIGSIIAFLILCVAAKLIFHNI